MHHLGTNIKLIQLRWGSMKQGELGKLLGVNENQISKYISGLNTPKIITFIKLVEITGIPFYDLCTRTLHLEELPENPLKKYNRKDLPTSEIEKERDQVLNTIKAILKENEALRKENMK